MTDGLLTPQQAAQIVGWSPNYFLLQRRRGVGPTAIVLGPRRIRYLMTDVIDWIQQQRRAPAAQQ